MAVYQGLNRRIIAVHWADTINYAWTQTDASNGFCEPPGGGAVAAFGDGFNTELAAHNYILPSDPMNVGSGTGIFFVGIYHLVGAVWVLDHCYPNEI